MHTSVLNLCLHKEKTKIINANTYFESIDLLIKKIDFKYDCIVALKRSGWMIGTYISNKVDIPIFTVSEINSIPNRFTNVIVVDDTICTGKSINKVKNKINKIFNNKVIKTACLIVEGNVLPDYYVLNEGRIVKKFYE